LCVNAVHFLIQNSDFNYVDKIKFLLFYVFKYCDLKLFNLIAFNLNTFCMLNPTVVTKCTTWFNVKDLCVKSVCVKNVFMCLNLKDDLIFLWII
jgi:hypothetical protein